MESTGAVAHLVSSLELLFCDADRAPGGLNDWTVLAQAEPPSSRVRRAALDLIASRAGTRTLHALRVAAAAVLLSPTRSATVRMCADVLLAGSWAALHPRHGPSTDGSDSASFVVQAACALARTGGGRPARVDACLWFVAAQGALAYAASGWAKVAGPRWRRGTALPGILRTHTFGHPAAHRLVQHHPRMTRVVGHAVVGLECAFPLALLGPRAVSRGLVAAVLSFHVANSVTMGMNRFVPAFGAMHWAVLYAAGPRRRIAGGRVQLRDDSFPAAAAASAALLAAGLQVTARRRRRTIAVGLPGEYGMPLASGNVVRVRSRGAGGDRPVLVLVHGVGLPVEAWEWLVRRLAPSFRVVTYRRPGYGSSTGPRGTRRTAVQDLVEVVRAQPREHGIVLVGHREGATLAAHAAADAAADAVVMIGPVPVDQLAGHRDVRSAMTVPLLRLGLGTLLREPDWISRLPTDVQPAVLRQYRDPSLWLVGEPDIATLPVEDPATGPAGRTCTSSQLLVLAPSSPARYGPPGAPTVTIPRVDTLEVLLDRAAAEHAADVVADFAHGVGRRVRTRRPPGPQETRQRG